MWFSTCNLILNRGIWIIYLVTIQLGMSLVFTFYHQGQWMSLQSNLTRDASRPLVPLRSQRQTWAQERGFGRVDVCGQNKRWMNKMMMTKRCTAAVRRSERWQDRDMRRDPLHTKAPMFTADNLASFQQLWGKLNLRKCSFSCPLDQTMPLSPKVYKNICLQKTVQRINISRLVGYVRTK